MRSGLFHRWSMCGAAAVMWAALGQAGLAQSPLSVIDWLGTQAPNTPATQRPPISNEPPVSENARSPSIKVESLSEGGLREIGLVPANITGLPSHIWSGSTLFQLQRLIKEMPDLHLPAAQSLLYTVLLAEAAPPGGKASDGDSLALARVARLVEMGALDPALSLIEQAGVTASVHHFEMWMQISLLTGTEDRACAVLRATPHLSRDYGIRIFCDARAGQWENAALVLSTAHALGLASEDKLALLDRFVHPEEADGMPPLLPPREIDPLSFRLFETIGEPIPTGNLPRAYAVADLRDLAGWKAQIEAAERLTRAGALPDNRLLGLYTERRPAASGGVWDRVAVLQRFETALASGSNDAVMKTLPPVWVAMSEADLQVTFASLFAAPLTQSNLTGQASEMAQNVALLSPRYEIAAAQMPQDSLPVKVAMGEVPGTKPDEPTAAAIYDAFDGAPPRADLVAMVAQNRLGEAVLHVLTLLHQGAQGNAKSLTDALATLRALGLEDTARRAALQILVLKT